VNWVDLGFTTWGLLDCILLGFFSQRSEIVGFVSLSENKVWRSGFRDLEFESCLWRSHHRKVRGWNVFRNIKQLVLLLILSVVVTFNASFLFFYLWLYPLKSFGFYVGEIVMWCQKWSNLYDIFCFHCVLWSKYFFIEMLLFRFLFWCLRFMARSLSYLVFVVVTCSLLVVASFCIE
jgi:hypothetical protein